MQLRGVGEYVAALALLAVAVAVGFAVGYAARDWLRPVSPAGVQVSAVSVDVLAVRGRPVDVDTSGLPGGGYVYPASRVYKIVLLVKNNMDTDVAVSVGYRNATDYCSVCTEPWCTAAPPLAPELTVPPRTAATVPVLLPAAIPIHTFPDTCLFLVVHVECADGSCSIDIPVDPFHSSSR